jgi:hypothetical protein
MPAWVSAAARPAPRDRTVFVRFGGTMFWAGWFRWPGKWFALEPGGRRREIADPPLWWDKDAPDQSIEDEQRLVFGQETTNPRPLRGARQALLSFEGDDSKALSKRDGKAFSPGRLV